MVFDVASALNKNTLDEEALAVFIKVKLFVVPVCPILPSMITLSAPLKFIKGAPEEVPFTL